MILSRVVVNDGESPVMKLHNCSRKQFLTMANRRYVRICDSYEISLDFVIKAITEKLLREVT